MKLNKNSCRASAVVRWLSCAAVAAALTVAFPGSINAQVFTTSLLAGYQPDALAVNPVTNEIYVANYGSNNVTVIDGAANDVWGVTVGIQPRALAVASLTNKIYVANSGDNTATVIDGATKVYTITNKTAQTMPGPIQLVLTGLAPSVTVANASGPFQGNPFVTVSSSSLPQGSSLRMAVQFADPSNAKISATPVVYSGGF